MADTLKLDILTPSGPVRIGSKDVGDHESTVEVPGVEVPGFLGEMGILPGHIPFITPVKPGIVRFKRGSDSARVAVGAGFLEVSEDGRVSIMTERAALPEDVDADAASKELSQVRERLAGLEDYALDSVEHKKLLQSEAWLEAQLRASEG